jgi:multidrug resistance efflux pump
MEGPSSPKFAEDNSEVLEGLPGWVRHGTVWLLALCFLLIGGVLYFGRIHVVVTAPGKILPEGDVVIVQALRPGVVNAIMAKPGDRLDAGTILVRLDISETGAALAQLKSSLQFQENSLSPTRDTLAMVDKVIADPQGFFNASSPMLPTLGNTMQLILAVGDAKGKLDGAQAAVQYWPDAKKSVEDEITAARESVKVFEENYQNRNALFEANQRGLVQKRSQFESFRKLADRGLASPVELQGEQERLIQAESMMLEERQRMQQLTAELTNQRQNLRNTESRLENEPAVRAYAVTTAKALLNQALVNLRQERARLSLQAQELETAIAATRQKIRMAEAQVKLTSITMPVKGVIADMKLRTAGEVVTAGMPVAAVLPEGVQLMVQATVANKDSGFVRAGLEAHVKVDAYPFQHYGTVPARVSAVLPVIGEGNSFAVKLQLLKASLRPRAGSEARLFPGLTVQAELMTASMRVADLLFSPAASR